MFFFSVPNYDFIGQEAYDQETIFNTAVVRHTELSILWARSIKVTEQSCMTGLTAICAFVYSCEAGLRSLTGVRLFSEDCPVLRRVRTVGVGTPTILTHNNLNKRPAWRIALVHFSCEFAVATLL